MSRPLLSLLLTVAWPLFAVAVIVALESTILTTINTHTLAIIATR